MPQAFTCTLRGRPLTSRPRSRAPRTGMGTSIASNCASPPTSFDPCTNAVLALIIRPARSSSCCCALPTPKGCSIVVVRVAGCSCGHPALAFQPPALTSRLSPKRNTISATTTATTTTIEPSQRLHCCRASRVRRMLLFSRTKKACAYVCIYKLH